MDYDVNLAKHFPGILGLLARAGFVLEAIALGREWGGTKRFIPKNLRKSSPIIEIVGLEAAVFLAKNGPFGEHCDIPQLPLKSLKQAIFNFRGGTRETAKAFGCSERYVRRVRQDQRTPQGDQKETSA